MAIIEIKEQICNPDLNGKPLCHRGNIAKEGCVQLQGTAYLNAYNTYLNHKRTIVQSMPANMKGAFDVMIIGDFPSRADVYSKFPFQSNSMEVLHWFIEKSGLAQDRIYVTNLVKCPGKIKPSTSEIKTCRDSHLFFEIQLIEPKVVILLGNTSLRAFNLNGLGSMNNIHGKVYEVPMPDVKDSPIYKVIPTFNPSYFVQKENKKLQSRVINDYRLARIAIDGHAENVVYNAKYEVADTLEKVAAVVAELNQVPAFAFDTESPKLGFMMNPAICYSLSYGIDKNVIIPIYNHDPDALPWKMKPVWKPEELCKMHDILAAPFENPNIIKIAHNIKYDVNVFRRWAVKSDKTTIKVHGLWADTASFHHLLQEEGPHSLDALTDEEFGFGDYSEPVRNICGQGKELIATYDNVPDSTLWPYTATDSEGTFRLYATYMPKLLSAKHLWQLYIEETEPMLHGLAEAEWYGHKMDLAVIDILLVEYRKKQATLLEKLRRQTSPEFNPNSPNNVIEILINKGFASAIRDENKQSSYSVDKAHLMEIRDACPIAGEILEYRSQNKIISTYLVNAVHNADDNHKIRHSWFPLTVTGRLSCTFFHQIPKVDKQRVEAGLPILRDMFIAEEGFDLISADYSQVELFILSIVANDIEMQKILSDPTRDLHAETTYEFLKKKIPGYTIELAKEDNFNRSEVGKRINFGVGYGSQGHALVKTGKWKDAGSIDRAFNWDMLNDGLAAWKKKFHGIGAYIENYPDECRMKDGIATSVFLRERRLKNRLNGSDDYVRGEAEREAINFTIQSPAGSITNRTIGLVYLTVRKLIDQGIIAEGDIRLVNTVHDSVIYQARKHLTQWFIEHILTPIGERPIKELNNHKFKMDIGVGQSWTQAES